MRGERGEGKRGEGRGGWHETGCVLVDVLLVAPSPPAASSKPEAACETVCVCCCCVFVCRFVYLSVCARALVCVCVCVCARAHVGFFFAFALRSTHPSALFASPPSSSSLRFSFSRQPWAPNQADRSPMANHSAPYSRTDMQT